MSAICYMMYSFHSVPDIIIIKLFVTIYDNQGHPILTLIKFKHTMDKSFAWITEWGIKLIIHHQTWTVPAEIDK